MKNLIEKYLSRNKKYRDPDRYNIFLSEYKTIYFFIPKVASTSMKALCSKLIDVNKYPRAHKAEFSSVLRSTLHKNDPYFKFSFVRNPYDRLVSCYSGKVKNRRNFAKGKDWENKSFEDFIKIICDIPEEKMNVHFKPQHTFITDSKGALLVDYVGKFEKIKEDFEIIKKKAGFPIDLELSHRVKSKHSLYTNYYTAETKKLVEERYEKDLLMFDYLF